MQLRAKDLSGAVIGLCGAAVGLTAAAEVPTVTPVAELVIGVGLTDGDGPLSPEPLVAQGELGATAEWLRPSGLTWFSGLVVGFGRDHPVHDPLGGRAGTCPPGIADCTGVRGPISGSFGFGPDANRDVRVQLEAAYVGLSGGWGEVSAGRDLGVGARFTLAPPTVLSGRGDFSGLGRPVWRNDLTGPSTKISALSTRILGVRLGASYTPEADVRGLEAVFRQGGPSPVTLDPHEVGEVAASFARTWGNGLRTEAAVTYLTAVDGASRPAFTRLESLGLGLRLSTDRWAVGATSLNSNNGWAAADRPYQALAVGASFSPGGPAGPWSAMVATSRADDDLSLVTQSETTAALRRSISPTLALSGGARWTSRQVPQVQSNRRMGQTERAQGLFVELVWKATAP